MHEWMDVYRELGFAGPDSYDTMSARIDDVDFSACQMPGKLVSVIATWNVDDANGYREMVCGAAWDARQVLQAIGQGVGGRLSEEMDSLRLAFGLSGLSQTH